MRDPFPITTAFGRLIRGHGPADLVDVALEIAADADPRVDPDAARATIAGFADRVRDRCASPAHPERVVGQINWVLFVEERFRGNVENYQDPANSYLHFVLSRKLGIPISLSVLYAAVAGRVGLHLAGVNLPLHFLLRMDGEGPARFVDPFHQGRILDHAGCEQLLAEIANRPVRIEPAHLAPCPDAVVVARMLRNLKAIYIQRGEPALALPVARRLAALLPDDLSEQRDWGMACLQADRPGEAVAPLERFVRDNPPGAESNAIRLLLRDALRTVAERN